jgi:hypothetical protein
MARSLLLYQNRLHPIHHRKYLVAEYILKVAKYYNNCSRKIHYCSIAASQHFEAAKKAKRNI